MTRPARMAARRTSSLSTGAVQDQADGAAAHLGHRDAGQAAGPLGGPVAVDADHQPAGSARLQLVHRSRHDQAAVVDDRHLLAEVLHLVELVAAEEHAAPGSGLIDQHLADGVDAGGIQSRQRLVQHQQLGIVDQRGRQLHPLLVPMRQRLHLGVPPVGDVEPFEPAVGGCGSVCCAEPVQPAQVLDLLTDEHARVQPALFGHVTEAAALGLADGRAVPSDGPGIEVGQTEDGPHRRRLARAVGSEKADDLSGRHFEGEVVESGQGPVGPAQSLQLQQSAHQARLLHRICPFEQTGRFGCPSPASLRSGSLGVAVGQRRGP